MCGVACSWNPSGTKFLTSSMDKTCKLWSFDAKTLDAAVTTYVCKPPLPLCDVVCKLMMRCVVALDWL
jgi:hypothetical protein